MSANLPNMESLVSQCYIKSKEPYLRHFKEYVINAGIDETWDTYVHLHPSKLWQSNMISFGMMYSRKDDSILYRDSEYQKLEEGQIYFINLKIIGSILQIPVMHEMNVVDHSEKIIQSCYLKGGKSEGSQWIRLTPIGENKTLASHETLYKGDSKIRDKYLYPYFHTRAINQFHSNIMNAVRNNIKVSQS
ncbi:MAG: hypothetical protein JXR03_12315 [Cyclobacteriaceae bacterium]